MGRVGCYIAARRTRAKIDRTNKKPTAGSSLLSGADTAAARAQRSGGREAAGDAFFAGRLEVFIFFCLQCDCWRRIDVRIFPKCTT